jgi:hypothetical protein
MSGIIAQTSAPVATDVLWLDTDELASTPISITVLEPLINSGTGNDAIIELDETKLLSWHHRKYIVGYDYTGPGTSSSTAMVTSELKVSPLVIHKTTTLSSIGVYVQVAATGGSIRLGIYSNSTSEDYPSTLVLDAGLVSATTTGAKTITISQTLTPGLYWLAAVSQGTNPPSIYQFNSGSHPFLPSISTLGSPFAWKETVAGALPATFTATKGQALYAPMISWRVSA